MEYYHLRHNPKKMMIDPICPSPESINQNIRISSNSNDSNINTDQSNVRDRNTIYDALTSNVSTLEDLKPFFCSILKMAGIDNIDPIFYESEPVDYNRVVLNFSALTAVGDPRFSLGHLLSTGYGEFFPIAQTQLEVIRNGGCQVIENYICDSDGNTIKKLEFECPENFTMLKITPEFVISRTTQIITNAIDENTKKFSDMLKDLEFNNWTVSLHFYQKFGLFYVKAVRVSEVLYYKYFSDSRLKVSENLGKIIQIRTDDQFDNDQHFEAMSIFDIPKY